MHKLNLAVLGEELKVLQGKGVQWPQDNLLLCECSV